MCLFIYTTWISSETYRCQFFMELIMISSIYINYCVKCCNATRTTNLWKNEMMNLNEKCCILYGWYPDIINQHFNKVQLYAKKDVIALVVFSFLSYVIFSGQFLYSRGTFIIFKTCVSFGTKHTSCFSTRYHKNWTFCIFRFTQTWKIASCSTCVVI